MSEFNVVNVQFKDGDCLVESLQELGYKCEVHESGAHLKGYMGDQRQQVANIIIRKEHIGRASNDLGFAKKADGTYDMIISEYDMAAKHGKVFTETLKQIYGKNMALRTTKRLGLSTMSVKTDEQGKIRIRLLDYGNR